VQVKICGVCRPIDAAYAAAAGAHYLGVILAPDYPRSRTNREAAAIFKSAAGMQRVGVFVDQPVAEVVQRCEQLALHVAQLHGKESPAFVAELRRSVSCAVWKKATITTAVDLDRAIDDYADVAHGLLLDSHTGGSGVPFEWRLALEARAKLPSNVTLIAAGGLTPENVRDVVAIVRPDVVDVASGVEQKLCEKSKDRIDAFVARALR
jgi:phosphoribosylanthranilate isomerase